MLKGNPFKWLMSIQYLAILHSLYSIFGLFYFFPEGDVSELTYLHVGMVVVVSEMLKLANMTCFFSVIF
jgi:hypothetical protein